MPNRCLQCIGKASYCKGPIETPQLLQMGESHQNYRVHSNKTLEWLDATVTAFIECYHVSVESQHEPGPFGTMQVDLRLEPPSDHDVVSDNQIHRFQLPAMREDLHFVWESSNLGGVLDAILSADVPLCMAPKCGSYDLSVYEVGSRLWFDHISHTDPEILFSVFVDVSVPAYRCCVARTPSP